MIHSVNNNNKANIGSLTMKRILEVIAIETLSRKLALNIIESLNNNGYTIIENVPTAITPEVDWKLSVPENVTALSPQEFSEQFLHGESEGTFICESKAGVSVKSKVGVLKPCYQCDKEVEFLFADSRCAECTSLVRNELGEGVYENE